MNNTGLLIVFIVIIFFVYKNTRLIKTADGKTRRTNSNRNRNCSNGCADSLNGFDQVVACLETNRIPYEIRNGVIVVERLNDPAALIVAAAGADPKLISGYFREYGFSYSQNSWSYGYEGFVRSKKGMCIHFAGYLCDIFIKYKYQYPFFCVGMSYPHRVIVYEYINNQWVCFSNEVYSFGRDPVDCICRNLEIQAGPDLTVSMIKNHRGIGSIGGGIEFTRDNWKDVYQQVLQYRQMMGLTP